MDTINIVTKINQLMKRGDTVMKKLRDTGVQEISAKSLKSVSGFNKGDMAPLLAEFYNLTKDAMNIITALHTLEKQSQAQCVELEQKVKVLSSPEDLNLNNIRTVIKEELKDAVPTITEAATEKTDKIEV